MMESVDNETAGSTTYEQVKERRRRKGPRRLIDYTKRGKFLPFSSSCEQQQQSSTLKSSSPGKIKKSCSDTIIRDKRQIQQRKEELKQTKEKISSSSMTRNEGLPGRQRRQRRRRRQCNTMSSLKVRPIANYRNRKLSVLRTKWNNNKKSSCERDEGGRRRRRRRGRRSSTHEGLSKSWNSFFTNGKKGISNVRKSISNTLLNSLTFSINKDDDDECNEKSSSLFLKKSKAQEQQQQEIMEEEEGKKKMIIKNCTITLNKDATDIIPQDEEGKEEEKIGFFLKIPPKHDRQYRHSDLREQYPPLDSSDSSVVSSSIFLAQQQHVVNEKNRERIRKRRNSISAFFNRRIPRRKTLKHWKTKTKSSRRLELEGGGRKKKVPQ